MQLLKHLYLNRFLNILFFLLIFSAFIAPVDCNDMPWHLKTGEYILANMNLPVADPFSYAETEISLIGQFILKQYWLAQIIFWLIFSAFGMAGLAILTATIFTCIAFLLWSMTRQKEHIFTFFVIGCYLAYSLFDFHQVRPQIFTFLFSSLTFYLIIKYQETNQMRYLICLPIMFFFWANMHGGYIFGIVILISFLIDDVISMLCPVCEKNKEFLDKKILFVVLVSIAFSSLNPNGYDAFIYAIRTHSTEIFNDIVEYKSPLQFSSLTPHQILKYWVTFPLSVSALVLCIIRRKIWALLIMLISMGMFFSAIRYFPLLVVVTTVTLSQFPFKFEFLNIKYRPFVVNSLISASCIVGIVYFLSKFDKSTFDQSLSVYNPAKAITFLRENHISGNIFGSYNKSSYLILNLYPESKVFWSSNFISSQRFNEGMLMEGKEVKRQFYRVLCGLFPQEIGIAFQDLPTQQDKKHYENWLKKIDDSGTEIIVHEVLNIFSGEPVPIVFLLLQLKEWSPVYFDGEVVIFLKNISKFKDKIRNLKKPNELLFDQLIIEGTRRIGSSYSNFSAMTALGLLLKGDSGKFTESLIGDALENDPKNQYALVDDMILKKMNKKKNQRKK